MRNVYTLKAVLILLLLSLQCSAITYTSTASGDWDDPGIWSSLISSGIPDDGDIAIISTGHTVDYDITNDYPSNSPSDVLSSLTVQSGAILNIDASTNFAVESWANSGTINASGRVLCYPGLLTSVYSGSGSTNIANTGELIFFQPLLGLSLDGTFEIAGKVSLYQPALSVTLDISADMTFKDGSVFEQGSSSLIAVSVDIYGSIVFEAGASYYPKNSAISLSVETGGSLVFKTDFTNDDNYRLFSSPILTQLYEFSDDIPLFYSGSNNVYYWDASEDGSSGEAVGWVAVTDSTTDVGGMNTPLMIYASDSGSSTYDLLSEIEISGDPYFSDGTITLYNYYDPYVAQLTENKGWNTIGNPYPCILDLEAVSNGLNLDYKAIHIWDAATSQYYVYLNGESSSIDHTGSTTVTTTNGFLRPFESFWVKMSDADGTSVTVDMLTDYRADTVLSSTPTYFKTTPGDKFNLSVMGTNNKSDATLIHLNANASNGWDGDMDAYKLKSGTAGVPSLYSLIVENDIDTIESAITTVQKADTVVIPVDFVSKEAIEYELKLHQFDHPEYSFQLIDRASGVELPFNNGTYTFNHDGQTTRQFNLVVMKKSSPSGIDNLSKTNFKAWSLGESLHIQAEDNALSEYALYNIAGTLVTQTSAQQGYTTLDISEYPMGTYFITRTSDNSVETLKIIF